MRKTKKKIFGKKAQVFMALFVVVVLIIFTTLYLDFAAKIKKFEGNEIGEKQFAVLHTSAEGEKALLYLTSAARYAYGSAVLKIARNNYVEPDSCGQYRGVPVIYGTADCMMYKDELQNAIEKKITQYFNDALNPYLEAYEDVSFVRDNYYLLFQNNKVLGIPQEPLEIPVFSETSKAIEEAKKQTPVFSATMFTQWPVQSDEYFVTSCFGFRGGSVAGGKGSTYHPGIDIRGATGTPVLSIGAGRVISVSPYRWGRVVIEHENNIYSEYVHLDTITVTEGETVAIGQIIGTVGGRGRNTANEYDSHLHFGIIDNRINQRLKDDFGNSAVLHSFDTLGFVNPLCYLKKISYSTANNLGCRSQGGPYKFCSLYNKDTGINIEITSAGTTCTASESTKEMLQRIYTNYGRIIEGAVQGTPVSTALVVAVIAAESGGNPDALSETGCAGLMQFCTSTAKEYGLENDERFVPEKIIPAGVALLQDNIKLFSSYTDKHAFALAAYNGGPDVIEKAIEATGKSNPTWQEVSAALNQQIIAEAYSDALSSRIYEKRFGTTEKRNNKVREIQQYVNRVMQYYCVYNII